MLMVPSLLLAAGRSCGNGLLCAEGVKTLAGGGAKTNRWQHVPHCCQGGLERTRAQKGRHNTARGIV